MIYLLFENYRIRLKISGCGADGAKNFEFWPKTQFLRSKKRRLFRISGGWPAAGRSCKGHPNWRPPLLCMLLHLLIRGIDKQSIIMQRKFKQPLHRQGPRSAFSKHLVFSFSKHMHFHETSPNPNVTTSSANSYMYVTNRERTVLILLYEIDYVKLFKNGWLLAK